MSCERSPALHRAHQRGVEAGLFAPQVADLDELCPYADIRTGNGTVTFSRAYRVAWLRGWCEGREVRDRATTGQMNQLVELRPRGRRG